MASAPDLSGRTFGRLTVVGRAGVDKSGHSTWDCRCTCGKRKRVVGNNLVRGQTKSCGCLQREARRARGAALRPLNRAAAIRAAVADGGMDLRDVGEPPLSVEELPDW